jgi:hypothetical protein
VAAASVGVDVAVNVLGISRRKPVLEPKPEEFSEVLELNREDCSTAPRLRRAHGTDRKRQDHQHGLDF